MPKKKYYPVREMIELAIFELDEQEPGRARGILSEALEDLPKLTQKKVKRK